ncbi:transcriptional activator FtrA [Delftia tsuruhatensis]|uniref:AraC family transcriptional regulator n=1 Tax=Delftia tsuruhatensis TaxID=180282 RepID=UPI001E6D4866|nr:AraC family transcriptional regulator [Delftia tsuruhatensis]CAB5671420.1 transcriptional activator FtrA [Delftia tsuruhatensis]CAC9683217.1 transcriptional activator FtrA [Delftia tsuruhatensis]
MGNVFWCDVAQQDFRLKPHFHDTYAFGFIDHGTSRYDCGAHRLETNPSTAFLINPGEVHSAFPASDVPISYTTFHVPVDYVRQLTGAAFDRAFTSYVNANPLLLSAMREAAACFGTHEQELAVESMLAQVLPEFIGDRPLVATAGLHIPGLKRARELLDSDDNVTLLELAEAAHMERAHFIRQFRRYFGLPPHQMRLQMRVIAARKRLFAGEPGGHVATATGFSDQSHLIRSWRAIYAAAPSQMKKVTIVQYD